MTILLTNDDGFDARGIKLLREKLLKYGRVVIVAPKGPMSAKSVSITIGHSQELTKIEEDVYCFDGTPADCASVGISSLDIKFDLLVSGCNDGSNLSFDTNYSGTIGACIQGLMYKLPCIAFSCEHNFEIVEHHFDKVFKWILDRNIISNKYVLNVNFPFGEEVNDIQFAKLYERDTMPFYIKTQDRYFAWRELEDEKAPADTDCYMMHHGIVSVSPLAGTFFSDDTYNELLKTK